MDHRELGDLLGELNQPPRNLFFLFLSDYGVADTIATVFTSRMPPCIDVAPEKKKADVDAYIKFEIRNSNVVPYLRRCKRLRKQVIRALEENAKGSFLWVNGMTNKLNKEDEIDIILSYLTNAPTSWRDDFRLMLNREVGNLRADRVETLNVSTT